MSPYRLRWVFLDLAIVVECCDDEDKSLFSPSFLTDNFIERSFLHHLLWQLDFTEIIFEMLQNAGIGQHQ